MKTQLYTRVFERVGFPMLDRLNGTTIAAKLAWLEKSEHRDPAEIARAQKAALESTVDRARRSSEFYRTFWATHTAARGLPSLYASLDGLPVVTKADLAGTRSFPEPAYRGRVFTARTSGSTGSPMIFHHSAEQESWFWALRFRIWGWAGYRPGDPYLTINLNPRVEWKKRLQDVLFRCSYLTFNADNQDSERILEHLRRYRIQHLNGFASSLFVLARYMLQRGITNPGVIGVTSTGDTLYPTYREALERAFGLRVLDYYGAGGEALHLASQCPESATLYHLLPENALVEILDNEGPVAPGAPGRVVVTQFHNDAMPLIRYELGDIAVAAAPDERCACGRTLPLLASVEGRIPDLVVAPDGTFLVTHFFVVLFKNLQSIHRYQIVQDEPDRIRARLVARPGAPRQELERTIRREVAAATRGSLATEFEWIDEIPLSGNGKRRLVISACGRNALLPPPTAAQAS